MESKYSIAKNQRLATYKLQESKVKKVEDHFSPPTEGAVARKESIKGLEILSKLLDEADVLIMDGSFQTPSGCTKGSQRPSTASTLL